MEGSTQARNKIFVLIFQQLAARKYKVVRSLSTKRPRQALALHLGGPLHFVPSSKVIQCPPTACPAWNVMSCTSDHSNPPQQSLMAAVVLTWHRLPNLALPLVM